jgi:hypothetical protein
MAPWSFGGVPAPIMLHLMRHAIGFAGLIRSRHAFGHVQHLPRYPLADVHKGQLMPSNDVVERTAWPDQRSAE